MDSHYYWVGGPPKVSPKKHSFLSFLSAAVPSSAKRDPYSFTNILCSAKCSYNTKPIWGTIMVIIVIRIIEIRLIRINMAIIVRRIIEEYFLQFYEKTPPEAILYFFVG